MFRQTRQFRKQLFLILICGMALIGATFTQAMATTPGTLSLVSMGTGDPDNMALRAQQAIANADIFFTMGGGKRHADITRGKPVYDAEHGLFSKRGPRTRRSAEEAEKLRVENRRIIREAVASGKNVVILDNGDPTIFGPQLGYLEEFSDLKPVIIPGISSFNAANAALQTSVVGGSGRAVMLTSAAYDKERIDFLAENIKAGVTMVFFMVRDLNKFISALSERLPGDMPVAIVANAGSSAEERVISATLDDIIAQVGDRSLPAYLLYVGDFLKNE